MRPSLSGEGKTCHVLCLNPPRRRSSIVDYSCNRFIMRPLQRQLTSPCSCSCHSLRTFGSAQHSIYVRKWRQPPELDRRSFLAFFSIHSPFVSAFSPCHCLLFRCFHTPSEIALLNENIFGKKLGRFCAHVVATLHRQQPHGYR